MTISALLSKLGARTPRFVTVNGRIVGNTDVTRHTNGYHHPQHGAVTPVPRHTFHGGEDPTDMRDPRPWWDHRPEALDSERENMARAFPDFIEMTKEGRPGWTGTIDTGRGKFVVQVVHRSDKSSPSISVVRPSTLARRAGGRMVTAPHRYASGHLCVADQGDWDPARHDAVTAVAWAAHWLAAYTEWRITFRWPAKGAPDEAA